VCHEWLAFNFSCYKFFSDPVHLEDNKCYEYGAQVSSVNSMEENEFISKLANQDVWLGFQIILAENDTWWSDNSPVTYSNFTGNHSVHRLGELGIIRVGGAQTGGWEYVLHNATFPYVCKKGYRCNSLNAPVNGYVNVHNFQVNATANFSCKNGFALIGNPNTICQSNSLWSSSPPTCAITSSLSELSNLMKGLSPADYTSDIAESVVKQLDNLTSNENLTSSAVNSTVDILETLVTLQEKVLEEGRSLNLSNKFVNVRLRHMYT
jgi:hypothetical protein